MAMTLKATAGKGGDYEQPEAGNQAAVLVAIVDLGTVEKEFKDDKYDAREVYLVWELPLQQMSGSTFNHVLGKAYTLSFGKKSNLRKMVEKWRGSAFREGEDFELTKLLGQSCLLDVQPPKEGSTFVRLDPTCCSRLPKGMTAAQPKRKPVSWDLDTAEQLPEHLDWLPFIYGESVCDRIKRSNEWREKGQTGQSNGNGHTHADEGEIPTDDNGQPAF